MRATRLGTAGWGMGVGAEVSAVQARSGAEVASGPGVDGSGRRKGTGSHDRTKGMGWSLRHIIRHSLEFVLWMD